MSDVSFCSCTDHVCAQHPRNHDKGCTPCIAKNLHDHEVPSCFFNKIGEKTETTTNYTFKKFAQKVMDSE